MKDMAVFLLKSLIGKDKEINFTVKEEQHKIHLSTKVDPSDKGKIIGKDGCIIKAVRTVMSAAGAQQGKKVILEIED